MNKSQIIEETASYIREKSAKEGTGHDWWHNYRVWKVGKKIALAEGADIYTVELGCLTHDIADYKLHGGDQQVGPRLAGELLTSLSVEPEIISQVKEIITTINFGSSKSKNKVRSLEAQCVQDADFLDAMGAIGIARCFTFGGARNNIIYDPSIPVNLNQSEEEYSKANHPSVNHIFEKLLLLRDRMNTATGKAMAQERHKYMEGFVSQFFEEWRVSW